MNGAAWDHWVTKFLDRHCQTEPTLERYQDPWKAGAAGYLLKQTAVADLINAVREVRKGNAFFSPAISKRLLAPYRGAFLGGVPIRKRTDFLTTREAEVLQMIAEGKSNKCIAAELYISFKTVEKHRQQVMNKLNINDIAGLTRYAIANGIIERSAGMQL